MLRLELPREARVTVRVLDLAGREVTRPVDGTTLRPGRHDLLVVTPSLPSGLYLCRVETDEAIAVRRMVLVH
jgi:hypothetical protein